MILRRWQELVSRARANLKASPTSALLSPRYRETENTPALLRAIMIETGKAKQ